MVLLWLGFYENLLPTFTERSLAVKGSPKFPTLKMLQERPLNQNTQPETDKMWT